MSTEAELQAEVDALRARLGALRAELRELRSGGRDAGRRLGVVVVRIDALPAGIELSSVREVVPAAQLAPLPEAPPWVLGALDLHGTTLPVVHVAARASGREPVLRRSHLIVVVEGELGLAGLAVDEVLGVDEVVLDGDSSLLEAPLAAYAVGTFSHGGRSRVLLGARELLRLDDVATAVGAARATSSAR
jgi:chemotaxis signal transduction protein